MRFQQLKRDPNSVVRKRLVKSKKNWVVLSSLSIAGGLLFLSAPTYIAKADTTTETQSVATTLTKAAEPSSTGTSSTATGSETKTTDSATAEKQATPAVTTPTTTEGTTSEKTEDSNNTKAPATDASTSDTTADKAAAADETSTTEQTAQAADSTVKTTAETVPVDSQAAETADAGKATTTKTDDTKAAEDTTPVKTDTTTKTATDAPATSTTDSTAKTLETTDPVATGKDVTDVKATDADATKLADSTVQTPVATSLLMANLATSKLQLAKMGIMAEALAISPETEVLADGNIAEGVQGTAPWNIDANGILHIGDSTKTTAFENNTTTTTSNTSSSTSGSSSTSTSTTSTPTSPWAEHAQDINSIIFDGTVNSSDDMNHMFSDLYNLTNIKNIDKLNMVTSSDDASNNVKGLFADDPKLNDISNTGVTNASPTIDLTQLNLSEASDVSDMFLNDSSTVNIILPNLKDKADGSDDTGYTNRTIKQAVHFDNMFKNNTSLTSVTIQSWQFSQAKSMTGMFQNDSSLSALDLSSWNMAGAWSTIDTGDSSKGTGMFDGTDSLKKLAISSINRFSATTALSSMNGNGWTGGGKTFASVPTNTTGSYKYNLNSIIAQLGSYVKGGTTFAPDGSTPDMYTAILTVPSNMGPITKKVTGPLYSIVSVEVPSRTGFTANYTKAYGNILAADKVTTTYYVTYTANESTMSVPNSTGTNISVDIPAGVVGTTSDPIDLPTVEGYETPQVKVEYTKDGNIITDVNGKVIDAANPIQYVGKTVNVVTPTLKDNSETLKVTTSTDTNTALTTAKVGDKVVVTLPTVTGYTPHDANGNEVTTPTITGTINADGKFVPDSGQVDPTGISYTGNTVDTNSTTVKTPSGQTQISMTTAGDPKTALTTGTVGDKVIITLPTVAGYTPQDSNDNPVSYVITGTIDADGNFHPDTDQINPSDVHYVGDTVDTKTTSVTTPTGSETLNITTKADPDTALTSGKIGTKVIVTLPTITGYKAYDADGNEVKDTTITGTIGLGGVFVPDSGQPDPTKVNYVGDSKDTPAVSFNTPDKGATAGKIYESNDDTKTPVTTTKVGDKVTLQVPQTDGYTTQDSTGKTVTEITGTIDANGDFVPDEGQVKPADLTYVGDDKKTPTVTFNTPDKGNTTAPIYESNDSTKTPVTSTKVGDKVTLQVPQTDGYTTQDSTGKAVTEITGTIDTNGDFVPDEGQAKPSDLTYVGNDKKTPTVTFNTPGKDPTTAPIYESNDSTKTPVTSTKVGDKVTLQVPQTDGYTTQDNNGKTVTEITGTIDADGNFKPDDPSIDVNKISYVGNPVSSGTATVKATQNGTTDLPDFTVSNLTGKVGDTIDVKVPSKTGYNSPTTVKGTILPDGKTVQVNETVNYEGLKYNDSVATVKTNNHGDQQVQHVAGQVGESVTVDVPHIEGYTPDKTTVTGIMDENGEVKPDEIVNYSPNTITTGTATIKTNKGNKDVTDLTGVVDKDGNVQITVPTVTGYTPNKTTITGTMGPNGIVTPSEAITYSPDTITGTATVKTNKGDKTVTGLTGVVDQNGNVQITVPDVTGYTPNKKTITGTMSPEGVVTPSEAITYSPNTITTGTATIKTNKGDKDVTDLTGVVDQNGNVQITVPTVTGYTPNKKTITGTMSPEGVVTPSEEVTYSPNTITTGTATIKTNKGDKDVTGLTGVVDQNGNVQITVPTVTGYTPNKTTITGTMSPEGVVTPSEEITYSPNTITTGTTTIKTNKGDKTVTDLTGIVDDKGGVTIKAPHVDGYTPDKDTITGTMNPNGTVTTSEEITYSPNKVTTGTTTIKTNKGDQTVDNLTGTVDDKGGVTIKVPHVDGYTPDKDTITGTMNPDGSVTPDESINYTPNKVSDAKTTIKTNKGDLPVDGLTGTVDDKGGVTIKVPHIDGYTPDKDTITGTMNPDGSVTPDESVNYTPNKVTTGTTTIKTNKGDKTVTDLTGTVDDKGGVTIKVPHVDGYTPDKDTITGTMNPDGSVTPSEEITYSPNKVTTGTTTIKTNKGDLPVDGLTGTVDDKGGVTIKVPHIDGYTPDKDTITGTMNPDGSVTPSEEITYSPNKVTTGTTTIKTNKGDLPVDGLTGTVDDKGGVTIKVPHIDGYTPDKETITGTMNPDGTVTPDEPITYTGNPVKNQTVNIPGTKDGQPAPQTVSGLNGKVGDTITVDVPQIPGYKADKTTIQATINPDGSISTAETVNYTKIPSHTNIVEPVVDPDKGNTTVEKKPLNVSTYYNKPNVQIYALDDKSVMQSLGERELPNGTNWYSDQMINFDGVNYYRVATNEYVKATQVYPYESVKLTIETHDLDDKPLYDAAGQLVETRKLAATSDWLTDRLITINGEKYYRVSSGEFVKASQVNPYKEVKANIQTNSTTEYKQLYNSRGVAIPGKVVAANSAWYTDRVVYINGVKYYRVATDEYIKADDVDTNIDVNITEL